MKRVEFLRALGIGVATAIVAPSILLSETKDPVLNATILKPIGQSLNKKLIETYKDQDLSGFFRQISKS